MTESLGALRQRRDYECRLVPERALDTLADAAAFLGDRGMLTRTADCALPSLYQACHEPPYRPGVPGFGSWPATKWPWAAELAGRDDVHALKVHNGNTIMLTGPVLALADPICRGELAEAEQQQDDPARLLRHLAQAGPSLADDVRAELGLSSKRLRLLRGPLERCGALVSRSVELPAASGGHRHGAELSRWDQAYPVPPAGPGGMAELLAAAVRAAVLAPERELARWFSWPRLVPPELVVSLVAEGRVCRPAPGWVAAPAA
jgi:hypothetical protein